MKRPATVTTTKVSTPARTPPTRQGVRQVEHAGRWHHGGKHEPYHPLWSRTEVKRVVEHIRTLEPLVSEIGKPK
jgi:hypothetical protein